MNSKSSNFVEVNMKSQTESLLGILIGLAPLVVIVIIFRNDDRAYFHFLKLCGLVASSVLGFMDITDFWNQRVWKKSRDFKDIYNTPLI